MVGFTSLVLNTAVISCIAEDFFPELEHDGFVGFMAYLESSIEYEAYENITFTGELLNEQGLYDTETGKFTCPADGVYYVTVGFTRNEDQPMSLNVQSSYTDQPLITCGGSEHNPWVTVAHSVLSLCAAGEIIWVESINGAHLYGDQYLYSTFGAWLLSIAVLPNSTFHEEEAIGFTVVKNYTQRDYSIGDVIHYNTTEYNGGDGYDQELNRYVCPVHGVYYLTVTSRKYYSYPMHMVVIRNELPFLYSSDTSEGNSWVTYTNNALISCEVGDRIQVRASANGSMDGVSIQTTVSFSMFLLNQDSSSPDVQHSEVIGFSVFKRTPQAYSTGDIIQLDGVLYNDGGFWNTTRNRFTVPLPGVYYVTLNAKRAGDEALYLYVSVNGALLFPLANKGTQNNGIVQSQSVLLYAQAGEVVQVRGFSQGSVYGDLAQAHTTFTVFLISPQ